MVRIVEQSRIHPLLQVFREMSRVISLAAMIFLGAFAFGMPGNAQTPPTKAERGDLQEKLNEMNRVVLDLTKQLEDLRGIDATKRESIIAARNLSLQSFYESRVSFYRNGDRLREHQQYVFAWQIIAANCLLGIVMIVSLAGVAFAGYEMFTTRRLISQKSITSNSAHEASNPATTIIIEPTKVHITSAVIGIVILGLSLGFLYLFLKEVYAIKIFDLSESGKIRFVEGIVPGVNHRAQNPPDP